MATFDPPKPKRRNKAVPCAICREPTREVDGVCGRCQYHAEIGKALEDTANDKNAGTRKLRHLQFLSESRYSFVYHGGRTYSETEKVHYRLLKSDEYKNERRGELDYSRVERELLDLLVQLADTQTHQDRYRGNPQVLMTDDQEIAYYKARACIAALCEYSREQGRERGRSFVSGLVDGSLSIKDLEEEYKR